MSMRPHKVVDRELTFSSMKLRQPSLGTKAAIFLPFLISWTRAHFRIAELGCLASIPLWQTKSYQCGRLAYGREAGLHTSIIGRQPAGSALGHPASLPWQPRS